MNEIRRYIVSPEEDGIRLDRWFKIHFPQVTFAYLNKLTRTGQMQGPGWPSQDQFAGCHRPGNPGSPVWLFDRRPADIPKGEVQPLTKEEANLFESMIIFEDKDLYVLNKPPGFAVQGGSKTFQHLDGLLMGLAKKNGERPLLVHRLDRDTSGVIVVAKRRSIASALGKLFATRAVKKTYWAVVKGIPKPAQGRIDVALTKAQGPDGDRVRPSEKDEENSRHAITYYAVVDTAPPITAWVSLKPVTGRQHQLRAHMAYIGTPISGRRKIWRQRRYAGRHFQEAPSPCPPHCVSPSARR